MLATFIVAKIQITDNTMAKKCLTFLPNYPYKSLFVQKQAKSLKLQTAFFSFKNICSKKHKACRKKYKPYILKYKALILK